jgi:DNA-directed RNA polymerase subunit RPC12/RpoP
MKGIFTGKDGSMGFETGRMYDLKSHIDNELIYLNDLNSSSFCFYFSVENMCKNWFILPNKERNDLVVKTTIYCPHCDTPHTPYELEYVDGYFVCKKCGYKFGEKDAKYCSREV